MTDSHRFLGKYQIIAELGRGGFATVYRARDRDLDRQVALKVLDPLLTRDPVWVARFRREAQAVARLDHPRVVTVYEIGQAEGALFIATKVVEGGSLAERLAESGALPWPDVLRITAEIAEALDYAHAQGVLHRDLKPANVLLDPRTGAVLTDFGFARLVADNSLSLSLSGGIVGTPAYIAPEVWEGKESSAATDVYALGCIVYELVTGQPRFQGATPPATMLAHFQPPPLPTAWPEGTPEGLTEVLRTALARDPQARFAVAGDLVTALAALSVDPLAESYAELEATLAAGQWQQALVLVDAIKARTPAYRDVAGLERRVLAGLEQDARARQVAQWRTVAEQAMAQGNLEGAELAMEQWRRLAPDDSELAQFKSQVLVRHQGVMVVAQKPLSTESDPIEIEEALSGRIDAIGQTQQTQEFVPVNQITTRSFEQGDSEAASVERPHISQWLIVTAVVGLVVAVIWVGVQQAQRKSPAASRASRNVIAGSDIIRVWVSEIDGMEMALVPAGEFVMGSPKGVGDDDEHPQHMLYLDEYWIDRTEVTNSQYRRCVEAGACRAPSCQSYGDETRQDHPVVCVSWDDAASYCQWVDRRLPTEAEWEKAARGIDARIYPWGNEKPNATLANFNGKVSGTTPVGHFQAGASPYVVLDMAGNVWEWTQDWYDPSAYNEIPRGNSQGPPNGQYRVLRGGSWINASQDIRSANRHWSTPDVRYGNYGFRCARSP